MTSNGILEHEFRLHVVSPDSDLLDSVWSQLTAAFSEASRRTYGVIYVSPHFRYKDGRWETKRVLQTLAAYHDGAWFKWVESKETPFASWSRSTHAEFVDAAGLFQNPFRIESRQQLTIDAEAVVYRYRKGNDRGIVFEWEYGTGPLPDDWPQRLSAYAAAYRLLEPLPRPPYKFPTVCKRKPVEVISAVPENCLVAHKYDGVFGIVYSSADRLTEAWEGDFRNTVVGQTLGDGFAYAAESLSDRKVVVLDVYDVRGVPVAPWSKRSILTHFLPSLRLPPGYGVQVYANDVDELPRPKLKTDGYVYHDTRLDVVYKMKPTHTIDLTYLDGHWLFPTSTGEMQPVPVRGNRKGLKNGHVYELDADGRVVRRRRDRFKGNSFAQLQAIFKCNVPRE